MLDFLNTEEQKAAAEAEPQDEGADANVISADILDLPSGYRQAATLQGRVVRLGISTDFQSQHLGSDVLSFIKAWFVDPLNKTGCRFLLVDSYNKERNLAFYERNGFNYLFNTEEQEREFRGIKPERPLNSRLMYFDLIELIRKE